MRSYYSQLLAACSALLPFTTGSPFAPRLDKQYTETTNGVDYNVFEHAATGAKIQFVTNSGVCETTPGVVQHSGYFSIGTNMNMWYVLYHDRP